MPDYYYVTTSRGFATEEEADEFARAESMKTDSRYSLLKRLDGEPMEMITSAVYRNGERVLRAKITRTYSH